MKTVRVGIIGVGVMGAEHARLLDGHVPGAEIAAVYDVATDRAGSVAAAVGAVVADDPMVLIKDDAVDAVLVASSDTTHEELVLAAIAAGKPVLCEKPLAPTTPACLGILAAEAEAGRRLVSLGFMRRFDPGYVSLRDELAAGAIGPPLIVHCIHRNLANAGVPSALLITGSLVHEIDAARWLLDEEIVSITIHRPRASSRAGGTQDPVVAVLASESGVHVDVEVFANSGYGYEVRCEVVGETGTLALPQPAAVERRTGGTAGVHVVPDWRGRFEDAYREELRGWVAAVAAGTTPATASAWDGYVATAVAEAGVQALETGIAQRIALADKPEIYA